MPKRSPDLGKEIVRAAATALVSSAFPSTADYRPTFVSNDFHHGRKVLAELESALAHCTSFDFSVAFITMGGIAPLLQVLKELEAKGVPGRVLTTDYLVFNEPEALEKLDSFKNVDVRMYQVTNVADRFGFHAKGYLFTFANGLQKMLVGSSNMTSSALALNREWNLEFTSLRHGELVEEVRREFEFLWDEAAPLRDVLDTYRAMCAEKKAVLQQQKVLEYEQVKLQPNAMQLAFISNLDKALANGAKRALLISATGTGKTYASAFALRHLGAQRVLFLAHREQVLKQSIRSYRRVFGNTRTLGLLSGNAHEMSADFVFATMQTMAKDAYLGEFAPDSFDIVVIDEVHRAGSGSYQKIMAWFQPDFYLGMTASPDRPDGFDIYGLFDNVIAYEIRLQGALENNLLCPFHYFGITDLVIGGQVVDDMADFNRLVCDARVDYVLQQAAYYGHSGGRVKGLVFCSTTREAGQLAAKFTDRGHPAAALSGADSQAAREAAIARLVADPGDSAFAQRLEYIFTVDIFNEGVDIPEVNQVIMLRPTESPIVFVQQLGRGLRKSEGKEYVVVLDFIGNYANNYMIPIALSGDRSYNKDSIRKYVMEGGRVIPGCSSVHFDEIARRRIFESIDNTGITFKFLKEKYFALKHKLGRIPLMADFLEYGEVDPLLFVERKRSYYRFLASVEPSCAKALSEDEHLTLEFASRYFGNGMRPHELLALKMLLDGREVTAANLGRELVSYGVVSLDEATYASTVGMLDKSFVNAPGDKKSYVDVDIVEFDGHGLVRCGDFAAMLQHGAFRTALEDLIDFGLGRYREKYAEVDHGLTLYEKYSRRDACRLLNWAQDNSSTVYGYRVSYGTCPIFVTYNKSNEISSSTQYADEFESRRIFSWMTRSRLTLSSPEVEKIINAERDGLDMRLFIKKSDSEGSDFYYFGRVRPISWQQTFQMDDAGNRLPIVNFKLELEHPVQDDLYEYFGGPEQMAVRTAIA